MKSKRDKVVNIEVTIEIQDKITEGVKTMMKMKEKGKVKVKLKKMVESALVPCVLTGLMEPKKQEALHKNILIIKKWKINVNISSVWTLS